MAKLRKTLGAADSPYIVSLMRLIETQSKTMICNWCIDYAEKFYLPLYAKNYPDDPRPQAAIAAAREWLAGKIKLPAAKVFILDVHAAARELDGDPMAQAAARAVGQAVSAIHAPTHALGVAFYGAAAVAYDRAGLAATADVYEKIAAEECGKYEAALRAVAIENEPNPAKINWNC